MGDWFGVAGGAEQAVDAGGGDVGEEGEQVDPDDDRLCGVGGGEGVCGAAGYEAVGGGMGPRTSVRSRRCRARSRDFGASMSRPPSVHR
ncbi:hypothetical protein EFE23_24675 [Micromonospora solifontis]|uniref:Uncharacterized protein n=1 Tax=Micromonospora solifontis TaxID=2487138 RepID=A0ABX9WBW1_9ACTN|nr:hypothetical protein EFE23_24675 [Micromonospora solifontis]